MRMSARRRTQVTYILGSIVALLCVAGCGRTSANVNKCGEKTSCNINIGVTTEPPVDDSGGEVTPTTDDPTGADDGGASADPSPSDPTDSGSPDAGGTDGSDGSDGGADPTTAPPTQKPKPQKVALAALCGAPGANSYICGGDFGGTVQVGGRLFQFYGENNANAHAEPPYWDLVLDFPANTCTKIVLQFAADERDEKADATANLKLTRTGADPVTVQTPRGTVGTLSATLDGGPFTLGANATDESQVVVNGYAVCTTDSGV
jgi:hypothetical protein